MKGKDIKDTGLLDTGYKTLSIIRYIYPLIMKSLISISFLLYLTGTIHPQTKPLSFISDQLSFDIGQHVQSNKLRYKNGMVYNKRDSFSIGKEYVDISFKKNNTWYGYTDKYYYTDKKYTTQHIILEYYLQKLVSIQIMSKDSLQNSQIIQDIEDYFERKFEWIDNSEYKSQYAHLETKCFNIYSRKYLFSNELIILISNSCVVNPYICPRDKSQKKARRKQRIK